MMGVFKILQYSEMECNFERKITEELFRKYNTLRQHKCENPIIVLKILYTLAEGSLNVEALGFSLLSLKVNPALGVICICCLSDKYAALGIKSKTGWLGIRMMYPSGATCLSADRCVRTLEL